MEEEAWWDDVGNTVLVCDSVHPGIVDGVFSVACVLVLVLYIIFTFFLENTNIF